MTFLRSMVALSREADVRHDFPAGFGEGEVDELLRSMLGAPGSDRSAHVHLTVYGKLLIGGRWVGERMSG